MWWLDLVKPEVLLMQETKLADEDGCVEPFKGEAGYEVTHLTRGDGTAWRREALRP